MDIQTRYNLLTDKFHQLDRALLKKEGEYSALAQSRQGLEDSIEKSRVTVQVYDQAQLVVQKLTELARQDTLDKIAAIVTKALQDVKDPTLEFRINYKLERNQPTVEFKVYDTKLQREMDLILSCGGTLVDIVEFPLKVSLLLKWHPTLAKVLVLDESMKHVATADRPKLASFIRRLSEKLGLQIILITHSTELAASAHKVFQVTHDGTKSEVQVERAND